MSPHSNQPDAHVQLPITEAVAGFSPTVAIDEATIRTLVDTFYDSIRTDPLLGPVFARHIVDWSLHLPKMYAFWSTVVLRTGRYAGRPLDAHMRLPGLTQLHFDRWLELWRQTVARVVPEAARHSFVVPAERMAANMSAALLRGGPMK